MVQSNILLKTKFAGASSGIGRSTALLFARLGAQLTLTGRNEDNLKKVAELCAKESGAKVGPIYDVV